MAPTRGWRPWLTLATVATIAGIAAGEAFEHMSGPQIEDALQKCEFVHELNLYKQRTAPETSSFTARIFEVLFPYGPAINALLATAYISGPPNFLLALCPPNIDPSSLSIMVAFAVGGLLGDTLFHLLPEIFLGEASPEHARFVLVNPNKNLILGVAIMVGFFTFVAMDKTLRIATGGQGGHDHGHNHSPKKEEKEAVIAEEKPSATTTGAQKAIIEANPDLKSRSKKAKSQGLHTTQISTSAYELILPLSSLNLLKDLPEPFRSSKWLETVLEECPEYGVTQIAVWKAYEAAFSGTSIPLVEATVLIHNASRIFPTASAQIFTSGPSQSDKKFIIHGARPRSLNRTTRDLQEKTLDTTPTPTSRPTPTPAPPTKEPSQSIRLSAYLNLLADFTHNITDGLALSSSFYASPTLGATTTVAVFFHEIPHEVGDFALLIQSGFSKRQAMGAQFVTAAGAFLGTMLGILVQEFGRAATGGAEEEGSAGLGGEEGKGKWMGIAGTGLGWEDMLLPFTAGTFLYVGTVAVIPELLELGGGSARQEGWRTVGQFLAVVLGAGIMLVISWS